MPTFDAHKNFVTTTVSNSPGTAGTTLTVATGTGATFPATPFNCSIFPSGIFPNILNSEIVRVTAISTDSLTITRQQESTTARNIIAGDIIALTVTSKVLQDIETAISSITSSSYPDITDASGNVGINTTTPNYTLDVNGTMKAEHVGAQVFYDSTYNSFLINDPTQFVGSPSYVNGNGGNFGIGTNNPQYNLDVNGFIGNNANGGDISVVAGITNGYEDSSYFHLDGYGGTSWLNSNGGNVGIRTNNPNYTLDVNGYIGNSLTNDYYIGANGDNSYLNSNGGNFGIGTNSPQYALDVNGNINFTGNLFYNGGQNWISSDDWGNTYFNNSVGSGGIVAQSGSSVQALIQVISTTQHVALVTDPLVNGEYSSGIYDFNYNGLVIGYLPNGNVSVPNNLGVGTPTPDYTLDVAGTGNISSNVTIGGTLSVVSLLVVPQLSTSTATSGTVSMLNTGYQNTLYLSNGSTITSITIALPTTTVIGQTYTLHSRSIVTTLRVTGGSFSDAAVTSLIAGQTIKYQATSTGGAYIRVQ